LISEDSSEIDFLQLTHLRELFSFCSNKEGVGGILYVFRMEKITLLNKGIFRIVCVVGRLDGF
jgi:hypothetical protein